MGHPKCSCKKPKPDENYEYCLTCRAYFSSTTKAKLSEAPRPAATTRKTRSPVKKKNPPKPKPAPGKKSQRKAPPASTQGEDEDGSSSSSSASESSDSEGTTPGGDGQTQPEALQEMHDQLKEKEEAIRKLQLQLEKQSRVSGGRGGKTRSWMASPDLKNIPPNKAPVLGLNIKLTAKEEAFVKLRDTLMGKWAMAHLVDFSKTWTKAATDDNKIQMCLEASEVLGWDVAMFDTQMMRKVNKVSHTQYTHTQLPIFITQLTT